MKDREFLAWIHQRLVHTHNENELCDYMHKLRCIIASIPPEQSTPNDGRGGNSFDDLWELLKGRSGEERDAVLAIGRDGAGQKTAAEVLRVAGEIEKAGGEL